MKFEPITGLMLTVFLVSVLNIPLNAVPVVADEQTVATVFVAPPTIEGKVIGENITVNVNVSNVNYLYVWQVGLTFNPSVLNCTGIYEGEFLKRGAGPYGTHLVNRTLPWNNTKGIVYFFACTLLGQIPGVNGSGQLCYITFEVVGTGISDFHLTDVGLGGYDGSYPPELIYISFEVIDVFTVSLENLSYSVEIISNLTGIEDPPDPPASGLFNHDFSQEEKTVSFDVITPYDNFYNVTIPKALLSCYKLSSWTVKVDGEAIPFVPTESPTHTSLYFTHHNSSHEIKITGTTTGEGSPVGGIYIPVNKLELLAPYIGLTILLAVAVIIVGYVKKKKQ